MRKTVQKIIMISIAVFAVICVFYVTVSADSVPMLTREYIQQNYEKVAINRNNYTLFITIVIFAVTAIIIPVIFFLAEKIKVLLAKRSSIKKNKKNK